MKWTWSLVALLGSAALLATGCASTPAAGVGRGEVLYGRCLPCHGADGSGNQQVGAPAIAGLPEWYLLEQLAKFRDGVRAYHPDDVTGLRMRPMMLSLADDYDLQGMAAFVASLPPVELAPVVEGDAAKGQVGYATCVACHAADGSGNEAMKAPPLKHLPDWYVVAQVEKFKAGIRGAHPKDVTGAQMRGMAMTLADEQAIRNVAAYIQSL